MSDSEDEIQDWRSLDARVLKRGEKDHAPDGTKVQQTTLQQSREAMYGALSKPASSLAKHIVECDWDATLARGVVRKVKGNYFTTIGWSESINTYVHPEEIIYLVQRGSMVCYHKDLPLTVEGVMSLMLSHISSEKLHVYSHLKRLGYVVRRAPSPSHDPSKSSCPSSFWTSMSNKLCPDSLIWLVLGSHLNKLAWKPFYSSYPSVFRDLQWVNPKPLATSEPASTVNFDFFIWKPSAKFKRSMPPPPDFRIRVVSADDPMPDLSEMENQFKLMEVSPSTKNSVVTRIREGCRSSIYAVVDNGVVGFVRAAEPQLEFISF